MNKLFQGSADQIKTTFGRVPVIQGAQGTALTAVSENFTRIGTIMTEGYVAPEYCELAVQKLYEAKLAVENAIALGWNNGKGQH